MDIKKILSLCLLYCFIGCKVYSFGQTEKEANNLNFATHVLQFDSTVYDFGNLSEKNKAVSHRFMFKNNGKGDLKILKVITACGCTTCNWSKEIIKHGMQGYVEATYSTKNQYGGKFAKAIYVFSNVDPDSIVLTLTGELNGRVKSTQDSFQYHVGNICFTSNTLSFGRIKSGMSDTSKNIPIWNPSESTIVINSFKVEDDEFSIINSLPISIPPHSRIFLPVHFTPHKNRTNGSVRSVARLLTNDSNMPEKRIFFHAEIY